jgi:hypothetical protein
MRLTSREVVGHEDDGMAAITRQIIVFIAGLMRRGLRDRVHAPAARLFGLDDRAAVCF